MKYLIIFLFFFCVTCSENNKKNNNYKKQSDLPVTGNSLKKKSSPSEKISDYY